MIKSAYNVSFSCPSIEGYDVAIIAISEENRNNKEVIESKLQETLAKKHGIREAEDIEIKNYCKRDLDKIKLSDITIQEFALLFDLGGHLNNERNID